MKIFLALVLCCSQVHKGDSMEILLALGGIVAIAALLSPPSAVPSEADYKKALEKLATSPEDPDANTVVGKYLAFALGKFDEAMVYLAKSGDKTLRTLAEHERAPLYADTAVKKVGLGDEWISAAKDFKPLYRAFYDRAARHYAAAWPDLDPVWKDKARIQGMKLAASRPPGGSRKGLPAGWIGEQAVAGMKMPVWDGSIAHMGSYSVKLIPPDEKVQNSFSQVKSDPIAIPPGSKEIEFSAWAMSNGTESPGDYIGIHFPNLFVKEVPVMPDTPFWVQYSAKIPVPQGATGMVFTGVIKSKRGNVWIDDASVKIDGKEMLKNPSLE